jgi:hypothetical protein
MFSSAHFDTYVDISLCSVLDLHAKNCADSYFAASRDVDIYTNKLSLFYFRFYFSNVLCFYLIICLIGL